MINKNMIENGLISYDDIIDNLDEEEEIQYQGLDDLMDNLEEKEEIYMDTDTLREKAIKNIKNLSTGTLMCAFDIIGQEYLGGEISYINTFDGFCDLIADFGLEPNEILSHMLQNNNYNTSDMFVVFDGEVLASLEDKTYFEEMLKNKMNGECAEFILGELNEI